MTASSLDSIYKRPDFQIWSDLQVMGAVSTSTYLLLEGDAIQPITDTCFAAPGYFEAQGGSELVVIPQLANTPVSCALGEGQEAFTTCNTSSSLM